jgi:hypothetical protein
MTESAPGHGVTLARGALYQCSAGASALVSLPWIVVVAISTERRVALHRRALWLEYFTVGWNVVEAVVAIGAGLIAGSVAMIGFFADSANRVDQCSRFVVAAAQGPATRGGDQGESR